MITRGRNARGTSMMEMVIAIGVTGFVFAAMGFLTFFSARNAINIRDQIEGQTSAAQASERIAEIMRAAQYFVVYGSDNPAAGPLTRVELAPLDTVTTQMICYDQAKQKVLWFQDYSRASFSTSNGKITVSGTPDRTFPHVSDFSINWESKFRLGMSYKFTYSGFALYFQRPNNPQYGSFNTDVIAKNHYPNAGVDYVGADTNPFRINPLPEDYSL
jgi:hypothetical protein